MPPRDPSASFPEPLVYFIDRCLGTSDVPGELRAGLVQGETIQIHDDLFDQDAIDQSWLTLVGRNRWVGFTKDDAIRRRPAEIGALLAANSAVFIFGSGGVTGQIIGAAFRTALPRIRRAVKRFPPAIIGRVNTAGEASVLWHSGSELPKAIPIR